MYKDLFQEISMQEAVDENHKSYSNKRSHLAKCLAVCFAIVTLASCGDKTADSMFWTSEYALNAYRSYLSDMQTEKGFTTDRLIETINTWQILRDSVFVCIAKDTTRHVHSNYESVAYALHDSLHAEITRLALEKQRTLADVLLIKEQTSRYRQDTELIQAVTEVEPFFKSLDSVPAYKCGSGTIIEKYRVFLSETLESGMDCKDGMLAFIKEEDRLFRTFLCHLPELADADLSAITRNTEKCCLSIFRSAENGKISYRDALIYIAKRTNRRIVLNTLACRNDINWGKVKTEAQARAYIWMLLQPYVALDGFGVAVLSDMERTTLHTLAEQTPSLIAKLDTSIGTDDDQWQVLPELLIKIMLTSI